MHIRKIDTSNKRDVNKFVKFPFQLYKDNKNWVPPLLSEAQKVLDRSSHPFYQHSDADFFLVENRNQVVGRIAAIEHRRFNEFHRTKTAFFGFIELVNDVSVAKLLFQAVEKWAKERNLDLLIGPKGLLGSDASGVLVDGFEHRPALNVPYNFDYYDTLIKQCGFEKERDNLSGFFLVDTPLPERLYAIAEKVKQRRGFWIKSFKTKDEMRAMVPEIGRVYQESFRSGYAFCPLTEAEIEYLAESLIAVADPPLIKLVMKGDDIIGFIFSYHDISHGLQRAKGKIWPFGWYYIMQDKKRTEWVNVNGLGILPKYQGLGANAVLYTELAKSIRQYKFKYADMVSIGEENFLSKSDNEAVGVKWYKRHRIYRKKL